MQSAGRKAWAGSYLYAAVYILISGLVFFTAFLRLSATTPLAAACFAALLSFISAALLFSMPRGAFSSRTAAICGFAAVAALLAARVMFFDCETSDYTMFLRPWTQFFRENGGLAGLKYRLGNYNVPYLVFLALFSYVPVSELYLIKLLSVIADLFLARAIAALVLKTSGSEKRALAAFAMSLALPTVFINGAAWGQCDSIFTALALWGLFCALDAKPIRAALLFGLALAFKLQSVFILPILLPLVFSNRLKLYHLPLVPAAYLAAVSPAIIAGRDIVETLLIYLRQGEGGTGSLNYNSPSVFSLPLGITEPETARAAAIAGIAAAFLFCLALFALLFLRRNRLGDKAFLLAAFIFACGVPLLLPHMHERYFFIADCLSLALAFAMPQSAVIVPLVSFASLTGYYAYFTHSWLILPHWGFLALFTALLSSLAMLASESKT